MDGLRADLKRLINECPSVVLERDDINILLNGRVQDLINRELKEDQTFSSTISFSDEDGRNDIITETDLESRYQEED